jgi:integrase
MYQIKIQRAIIWLPVGQVEVRLPKWESLREVLLPPHVSALIEGLLDKTSFDTEALLFPRNSKRPYDHVGNHKITRIWTKAREAAKYKGSLHSLRSFAGTQYAVAGATLRETMERLGHSSSTTAMRYQKAVGREVNLVNKLG